MPDITMCCNWKRCKDAHTCRRSEAISKPGDWQSWSEFEPVDGGRCSEYWEWPPNAKTYLEAV